MTALATLEDIAAVSRAVPQADEDRVNRLLEMVSASVRRYTGQTFDLVEDVTATVYPVDGEITGLNWPITEATATQNGAAVEVEPGPSGRLYRLVSGQRRPWSHRPVTITYSHGYATVPDDIAMVVAEVTASRWNAASVNPTMITGSTSQDVAGYSESQSYRLPTEAGEAWSALHRSILDGYRQPKAGAIRLAT